jgi:nucleoside-diphosphate-sugar epimerase
VPRALIVGCGCHGRALGERLASDGWQVRGTSRDPDGLAAIETAGLKAAPADPDRPGTILELCGDVSVVVWLLGSAAGDRSQLDAIHGPRLERLLEKLVDSPVRGFAYEATGSVPPKTLGEGRAIVERAAGTWRIPIAMIEGDRSEPGWADRGLRSVLEVLGG